MILNLSHRTYRKYITSLVKLLENDKGISQRLANPARFGLYIEIVFACAPSAICN